MSKLKDLKPIVFKSRAFTVFEDEAGELLIKCNDRGCVLKITPSAGGAIVTTLNGVISSSDSPDFRGRLPNVGVYID